MSAPHSFPGLRGCYSFPRHIPEDTMPKPTTAAESCFIENPQFIALNRYESKVDAGYTGSSPEDVAKQMEDEDDFDPEEEESRRVICQLVPVAIVRQTKRNEFVPIISYNPKTTRAVLGKPESI